MTNPSPSHSRRFRSLLRAIVSSAASTALTSACLAVAPDGTNFLCNPATETDCDAGVPDAGMSFLPASHSAWPQLVNDAGTVIASPRLVTIAASNDPLAPDFFSFADSIVNSPWLAQVGAEYGVGAAVSGGHFLGAPLPGPDGGSTSMTLTQYQDYLQSVISSGAPAPNGETIYLLVVPAVDPHYFVCTFSSFPASNPHGDMLLVIPRGKPLSGETLLDEMTVSTTRCLINELTDPTPPLGPAWTLPPTSPPWAGEPWAVFLDSSTRAGDLCLDTRIEEPGSGGSYAFARAWSNAVATQGGDPCVPSSGQAYYSVTFPQQWVAVSAGQSTSIPFTGWSTAPVADWSLHVAPEKFIGGFSSLTELAISSPLGEAPTGNCAPSMNNGVTASLQFTVPENVSSGDFAVLDVTSVNEDPTLCSDPPPSAGDAKHHQEVGVYVP
jgi:hypothetical protein